MHCFPVGAALQDDGNLPSGVFLGGSLPAQLAELALATTTSASAEAITSGRIARGTRSKVQPDSDCALGGGGSQGAHSGVVPKHWPSRPSSTQICDEIAAWCRINR